MEYIYITLFGLWIIAIFILCRGIYKMDKREREEIQERTDLEIEGMKKRISDECKFGISRTLPCDHCKMARACKRCYDTPRHNGCDDWETDDVLAAYELLKEDK